MSRAVAYVRQSRTADPDDSLSLSIQERVCRDLAATRGLAVAAVFADPDRRGWDEDRPGLRDAFALCETGGVSHFLIHDMSRLARSVRLQEQYVHRLSALGVEIVSSREPWAGSPLYRQILGAVAEEGTRVISANWRNVLRGRARRGLAHGTAPFGYRKSVKGGALEFDPEAVSIVTAIFSNYLEGWNVADLALDLTRRGVPTPRGHDWWRPETVAAILDNPVYAGLVVLNGERIPGAHPAIVDADTFAAVEVRRADASRPARKKPCSSWLEGSIYHQCGARAHLNCTPASRPDERPRFRCWRLTHPHSPLGRCTDPRPSIAAHLAQAAAIARLADDLAAILPVRSVIADAVSQERRQTPGALNVRKRLETDASRVNESRKRAEDLYLSGARDRAWFDATEATHAAESARIARELAALPTPIDPADIRSDAAELRQIAPLIAHVPSEQIAPILAKLGIVVVGGEGVRVLYRGRYAVHLAGYGEGTAERFLGG